MDSSFVVVAKTVMENRQMIAAMIYELSITNTELLTVYETKLAEIQKSHQQEFDKMNDLLEKLNSSDNAKE